MKFNLVEYTHAIQAIADTNKCTYESAVNCFITNLTIMREHYKGASELNYHELGQKWNKLLSKEKVAQKAETVARMRKYTRAGGKNA